MLFMFLLRAIKFVLLLPVWILIALLEVMAKLAVKVISICHGLLGFGLTGLLIGTLLWYRDSGWRYIMLFVCAGAGMVVLMAGIWLELLFEDARKWLGSKII